MNLREQKLWKDVNEINNKYNQGLVTEYERNLAIVERFSVANLDLFEAMERKHNTIIRTLRE